MKKKLKKIFATLTLLAYIVTAGNGCSKPIENHSKKTNTGKDKDNTSFSTQNSQNVICIEDRLMPGPEFSVKIGTKTLLNGKIILSDEYNVPYKIDIEVLGKKEYNISIECSYVLEDGQLAPVLRPSQINGLVGYSGAFYDPYYEIEAYIGNAIQEEGMLHYEGELHYSIDWTIPLPETFNWVTNNDGTVTGIYDFKLLTNDYTYVVNYSDETRTSLISSYIQNENGEIISTSCTTSLHAVTSRVLWRLSNGDEILDDYSSAVHFFEETIPKDEDNLTEKIVKEEKICDWYKHDFSPEKPIARIEYYEEEYKLEFIDGKQVPLTRPSKTIIYSKCLEEPITINYTYNTHGDLNSRKNQIETGGKETMQWVDSGSEIKYYTDWIKRKYSRDENYEYSSHSKYFYTQTKKLEYSPTGKLERESIFVMDTPVLYTDFSYTGGRKSFSTMYYEEGEPVLLEEYSSEGTLANTYEYLKAANGCSYVDHFMTTTGVHHISINDSAGNTTLDITSSSNSTLTKSDVGNYLVIYFSYPDGTGDIYEIDSEGTLAYRTMISKINAGQGTRVYRYIGDTLLFSQDYDSAEFNIQEFLPWSKDYVDSWKELVNGNDRLSYTDNITPDSYLQTSTLAYPDETFSEGTQHTLTKL